MRPLVATVAALGALAVPGAARAAEVTRFVPPPFFRGPAPAVVDGAVVWGQPREDGSWTLKTLQAGRISELVAFGPDPQGAGVRITAAGNSVLVERERLLTQGDPRTMEYIPALRDVLAGPPAGPLRALDSWRGGGNGGSPPPCWAGGFVTWRALVDGSRVAWVPCAGIPAARVVDLATGSTGPSLPLPLYPRSLLLQGDFLGAEGYVDRPGTCSSTPCLARSANVRDWRTGAETGRADLAGEQWSIGAGGTVSAAPPPLPSVWRLAVAPNGAADGPATVWAVAPDGGLTAVGGLPTTYAFSGGSTDGRTAALFVDECGVDRLLVTAVGASPLAVPSVRCPTLTAAGPARLGRDGNLRFRLGCRPRCRGVVRADLLTAVDAYDFTPPVLVGRRRIASTRRWQDVSLRMPVRLRSLKPESGTSFRIRLRLVDEDAGRRPVSVRFASTPYRPRSGL